MINFKLPNGVIISGYKAENGTVNFDWADVGWLAYTLASIINEHEMREED